MKFDSIQEEQYQRDKKFTLAEAIKDLEKQIRLYEIQLKEKEELEDPLRTSIFEGKYQIFVKIKRLTQILRWLEELQLYIEKREGEKATNFWTSLIEDGLWKN